MDNAKIFGEGLTHLCAERKFAGMNREHPLRAYRKKAGLTLQELADRAGTTPATLSRIERYELAPSLALISRLKKAARGKLRADDFLCCGLLF